MYLDIIMACVLRTSKNACLEDLEMPSREIKDIDKSAFQDKEGTFEVTSTLFSESSVGRCKDPDFKTSKALPKGIQNRRIIPLRMHTAKKCV